ncbi:MAG: WD40 repeat domain-containing protein [Deltaproteobacteria bacterium]|nr:WD40 repeat domain-containing protein [Deltaproteobacteria bacterium]
MEATQKSEEKVQPISKQGIPSPLHTATQLDRGKDAESRMDWDTKEKMIANIDEWKSRYAEVRPFNVSEDGEKIGAVVQNDDEAFTVCINGNPWEETYEKIWSLKFTNEGKAACLVLKDNAWTVALDGIPWNEKFDYAWNLQIAPNGRSIGINIKKDDQYGVCLGDKPWVQGFADVRNLFISSDGTKAAASVAVKRLAEADIFNFQKGVWTVAVNGVPWDKNFVNVWGLAFSPDGRHVAAETRINLYDYAVVVDGNMWPQTYKCVCEPCFTAKNNVIAPVKIAKGWTLALDGKPIWGSFIQVWPPKFSPDGQKIAAVVASEFGRWTIAVDGSAWKQTFSDTVLDPVFSPDGKRVAAIAKESKDPMNMGSSLHSIEGNDRWTIVVDGIPWNQDFDMIWDPVFSPDGSSVAAKAEINGKYCIAVNGKAGKKMFDAIWSPSFSPRGDKILVRCIKDGKYYRYVVPLDEI